MRSRRNQGETLPGHPAVHAPTAAVLVALAAYTGYSAFQ